MTHHDVLLARILGDGHEQSVGTAHQLPIMECSERCRCDTTRCRNRVVSRGVRVRLAIFFTSDGRGWGLRAVEPLRRGQFVCEYAGELVSSAEAAARRLARSQASTGERAAVGGGEDASCAEQSEASGGCKRCGVHGAK